MAQIKSALELALERTADIKSNKSAVESREIKDEGRRLSSRYLAEDISLEEFGGALTALDKKRRDLFIEGCFTTLMANLTLPGNTEFSVLTAKIREGMKLLVSDKRSLSAMFDQIDGFFAQYIENRKQIEEKLSAQYEPRLRQKEQEMSRQTGYAVKLTPMQDPEFMNILQQNISQLEQQYNAALIQAKDQLKTMTV